MSRLGYTNMLFTKLIFGSENLVMKLEPLSGAGTTKWPEI